MDIEPQLLEKMKSESKEFKKLYEEHVDLKSQVENLNKRKFLTPEQELEKKGIQKQKLKRKQKLNTATSLPQSNTP